MKNKNRVAFHHNILFATLFIIGMALDMCGDAKVFYFTALVIMNAIWKKKHHKRVFDSMPSTNMLTPSDENEIIVSNIIHKQNTLHTPSYAYMSNTSVLDEFNFLRTIYNLNEYCSVRVCVRFLKRKFQDNVDNGEREREKKSFWQCTRQEAYHFIWALFNGIAFKYHWEFIWNDFLLVCVCAYFFWLNTCWVAFWLFATA